MSINSVSITPFLNGLKTVSKDTAKLKSFLEEQSHIFNSASISEDDWDSVCEAFNQDCFDCEITDGIVVRYDDRSDIDEDTVNEGAISIILSKDLLCQAYPNILADLKELECIKNCNWIGNIDTFLENATYEFAGDVVNISGDCGSLQIPRNLLLSKKTPPSVAKIVQEKAQTGSIYHATDEAQTVDEEIIIIEPETKAQIEEPQTGTEIIQDYTTEEPILIHPIDTEELKLPFTSETPSVAKIVQEKAQTGSIYHAAGCAEVKENEVVTVEETTIETPIDDSWKYDKDNKDAFPFIETAKELNTTFAQYANMNFSNLKIEEAKTILEELKTLLENANIVKEEARKAYFQETQINSLIDTDIINSKIQELEECMVKIQAIQDHYDSIEKSPVSKKAQKEITNKLMSLGVKYELKTQEDGTLKVIINGNENSYIIFNGENGEAIEYKNIGKIILREIVYRNNPNEYANFFKTLNAEQKKNGIFSSDENGESENVGMYETVSKTKTDYSTDTTNTSYGSSETSKDFVSNGAGISSSVAQTLKEQGYIDLTILNEEERNNVIIKDTSKTQRTIEYDGVIFTLEYDKNGEFKKVVDITYNGEIQNDIVLEFYPKLAKILGVDTNTLLKNSKLEFQTRPFILTLTDNEGYFTKTIADDNILVSEAYQPLSVIKRILAQVLDGTNLENMKNTLKTQLSELGIDYNSADLNYNYDNKTITITYTKEDGSTLEFIYDIKKQKYTYTPIR